MPELRLLYKCLSDKPSRLFWLFATTHIILWTLIPVLTSPNAPLDVIEGYAWGREWLIGTYKHPPMQAWWLEALAIITGRAAWSHFFASQFAIGISFWAVWQTGRRLTDDVSALLGVLLLEGAVYYNFTSPEFNPNVLQLPFWALACWSFHRAVKENSWFDWVLLGMWGAGGLYTKYSTALMLAVLAGVLIFQPEARRRLRGIGPYLALIVLLVLFAPHVLWLVEHDFLPFSYAGSRSVGALRFVDHFIFPFMFLMAQVLSLLALILLFAFFTRGRLEKVNHLSPLSTAFDKAFLHAVTWGPIALLLLGSALMGFRPRDMWGACLWNFIGLWLVVFAAGRPDKEALRRFIFGWSFVFVLGLSVISGSNWLYPYIKKKDLRVHFPGQSLGEAIVKGWQARYDVPLTYVIGDTWLAGNVAYYAPVRSRPHVFIGADYKISTWTSPEDVGKKGGVIVWCGAGCSDLGEANVLPPALQKRFPSAQVQQPITVPRQTGAKLVPVIIGWAIVPPA